MEDRTAYILPATATVKKTAKYGRKQLATYICTRERRSLSLLEHFGYQLTLADDLKYLLKHEVISLRQECFPKGGWQNVYARGKNAVAVVVPQTKKEDAVRTTPCACGCGGFPKGKHARFLPGHDARWHSAQKNKKAVIKKPKNSGGKKNEAKKGKKGKSSK